MPRHIRHSGIEAHACELAGERIYELTSPAGREGIARKEANGQWLQYPDVPAMRRGGVWSHAPKLEILLEGIAREVSRGLGISGTAQYAKGKSA